MGSTERGAAADVVICVSGADGCGKSTLVAGLAAALPGSRVVTIWDLMGDPRARPLFADKAQVQVYLGSLEPESRALFLCSCLKAAMERAPRGLRVVDAYWYKYLANELVLGAAAARLEPLAGLFERPHLALHVELPPAVAAERKQGAFSPYECGLRKPSAEHFVDFQARTAPEVRRLIERDARQVVLLDGREPASALLDRALASARRLLT